MAKQIYVINGSGGKGKDQFVKFIAEKLLTFNISSVDKIKEAATIIGWDGGKTEKDRLFLSNMKLLSTRYNDNPFQYVKRNIEYFQRYDSPYSVMFIHIREGKEIDRIKYIYDCKTILIKNINVKDIKSNMADANVENYKYDYIIENNDDLELLKQKAYEFINNIKKENN